MRKLLIAMCLFLFSFCVFAPVYAQEIEQEVEEVVVQEVNTVSGADTAFIIICAALVMIMTPGVALFYGGMVRRKNVLGMLMQSFVVLGIATVIWMLYGYSLAFGPDIGHVIGSLKWAFLDGVGLEPDPTYSSTLPHQLYMAFQMMFAVLTPALITGAFAERFKFKAFIIFIAVWITIVYCPIAHWVWGQGGWIGNLGGLDFAGGLVVHIASGTSAFAAILILGVRNGYKKEAMPPHNLPITFIGAAILWIGWFGFNAGSALEASGLAVSAFVVTHIAAGAALLSWMIAEWLYRGKPTVLGAVSGAVAGLVAITPAAGFVTPISALIIGFAGGIVCFLAVNLKERFGYDDSLDVIGVHGVGGILGALLTGIFATTLVNPDGANGGVELLKIQTISVISTIAYSFIVSFIILKVIDKFVGIRVEHKEELQGLDLSQHGESGYRF